MRQWRRAVTQVGTVNSQVGGMGNKHTWEAGVSAAGRLHVQEMWWELGLLRFLWAEAEGKMRTEELK